MRVVACTTIFALNKRAMEMSKYLKNNTSFLVEAPPQTITRRVGNTSIKERLRSNIKKKYEIKTETNRKLINSDFHSYCVSD